MKKSTVTQLVISGLATETFSHIELGDFNVSAMRALCKGREVHEVPVPEDFAAKIRADRDVDEDRVNDPTLDITDPIIMVYYPPTYNEPESYLLIDGTHRVLRRHMLGLRTALIYVFYASEALMVKPSDGTVHKNLWGQKDFKGLK